MQSAMNGRSSLSVDASVGASQSKQKQSHQRGRCDGRNEKQKWK